MTITEVFPPKVLASMKEDLQEAGGHEVLWVAQVDANLNVTSVEKVAEGTIDSVAVLRPWAESGDAIIHNHPSGNTHPSKADLDVAHQLGEWGVGFIIVDNKLTSCRIVARPLVLRPIDELEGEKLAEVLKPGGKLSQEPGYEYRSAQVALLEAIVHAFNRDKVLVAEAGTGIGKSYAYLLPALNWAQKNKERVVISTGTINLQRQVLEKDIPRVQKLLGTRLRAELVKGRSNYLCPARLAEALKEADPQQKEALKPFADWAETSPTGDREDFNGSISPDVWSEICSEKEICAGFRCGLREDCFVTQARKRAAAAQILVVNHHLLLADLSLRLDGMGWQGNAVLPPFRRLVIDEAHKIEESATSYFSQFYSRRRVLRLIRRLFRRKKRKQLGVLVQLSEEITLPVKLTDIEKKLEVIDAHSSAVQTGAQEILGEENSLWMREIDQRIRDLLLRPLQELQLSFLELTNLCQKINRGLSEKTAQSPVGYEFRHLIERLQSLAALMGQILQFEEQKNLIYWLERSQDDVNINISPIELGPYLHEALFEPIKTVVAVSATLAVRQGFDYFLKNSGADRLPSERRITSLFESPFDYASRVLLGVPTDIAPPEQKVAWFQKSLEFTRQALKISGGGALLLFTSYEQLREARDALQPFCAHQGINLYHQGQTSNSQLLRQFNQDVDSILLATYSFWEGVDSPGDTLRLLIIFKLPFSVPTDPVRLARSEYLEKMGRNSFRELSLPEAVIRLKQGFGRLMRRSDDGGAVLILDSRLVNKFYGREFLDSLPPARQAILPSVELTEALERHFRNL